MSTLTITVATSWGITYADGVTPDNSWKPYYGNNNGVFTAVYNYPWPGRAPALKLENGNYVGVTGCASINDHHAVMAKLPDAMNAFRFHRRCRFATCAFIMAS